MITSVRRAYLSTCGGRWIKAKINNIFRALVLFPVRMHRFFSIADARCLSASRPCPVQPALPYVAALPRAVV